jgi:hypothetical protein
MIEPAPELVSFALFAATAATVLSVTIQVGFQVFWDWRYWRTLWNSDPNNQVHRRLTRDGYFKVWLSSVVSAVLTRFGADWKARRSSAALAWMQESSCPKDAVPTQILILVHGAFGKLRTAKKFPNFARALSPYARSHIYFFQWDGANTELARRAAGQTLKDELIRLKEECPHVPVTLVGHSHGGNVIVHAVRELPHSWNLHVVTIGTPLLSFDVATDSPAQLQARLFMHCVYCFVFPATGALVAWVAGAGSPFVIFTTLTSLVVAWTFVSLRRSLSRREAYSRAMPRLGCAVSHLRCENDEAIQLMDVAENARNIGYAQSAAIVVDEHERWLVEKEQQDLAARHFHGYLVARVFGTFALLSVLALSGAWAYSNFHVPPSFQGIFAPWADLADPVPLQTILTFVGFLLIWPSRTPNSPFSPIGRQLHRLTVQLNSGLAFVAASRVTGLTLAEGLFVTARHLERLQANSVLVTVPAVTRPSVTWALHCASTEEPAIISAVAKIIAQRRL